MRSRKGLCFTLEHPSPRNVVSGDSNRRIVVNISVPTYGKTYYISIQPTANYETLCAIVKSRLRVLRPYTRSEI